MVTHSDLEISELKDKITLLWYKIRKSELLENKADADEKKLAWCDEWCDICFSGLMKKLINESDIMECQRIANLRFTKKYCNVVIQ